MGQFEHVFRSIRLGEVDIPNRIIMPAMHMGMAEDGFIKDGFIDFYEERASADPGPGLMIIGGCYPEKRGMGAPNFVAIDDDRYIPRLREFNRRIRGHGTRTAAQLYHGGRYSLSFVIGEQPVSASAVPSRFTGETPRALTVEEIAEVQENYARAARRAREADFDAVELICAAGYLVNQFLSPLTNLRDDRYGGDIYGRMTFMLETIRAIKSATADDFPLICRLSGSDFMEGSHTLEESKAVALGMQDAGVDLISVTGGWHETRVPQITMNVPRGAYVYLAEGIKQAVETVPVAACNRINDPRMAEQVLAEGRADLVAMGRAFIADPEVLSKARDGRPDDIVHCIACNQGCFDHIFMLKPIECTVNPRVNRERSTEITPAEKPKKVLVAGGGPAGLEAARIAARRGHTVVLCEEDDNLGGQGLLASLPPGREEWAQMVADLVRQVQLEGVEVRTGITVGPEVVEELRPEVLVMATGALQLVPDVVGVQGENVVLAWDVLEEKVETGDRVVVVGGGAVGLETGAFLAERGREVTVVEMAEKMGADIGLSTRWTILQDAARLGVKFIESCCVQSITESGVVAVRNGGLEETGADTVVIAVGSRPRAELLTRLEEAGLLENMELYRVGDCREPRKAFEAIHEGFEVALEI